MKEKLVPLAILTADEKTGSTSSKPSPVLPKKRCRKQVVAQPESLLALKIKEKLKLRRVVNAMLKYRRVISGEA